MGLLTIEEPEVPEMRKPRITNHPLLRLGFRPFYLLAAAFAAVSVPLWMARYFGWLESFSNVGLNWHMHEMIFGFVIAVVIGFLYTAGRNWTGLWTPIKGHLAALAGLWIAGRIAMLTAPPLVAAIVDILFLPLATWPFFCVLNKASNRRNMFLVGLLGMLALANTAFHASVLGWLPVSSEAPVEAAILMVVMLASIIAGRVIPGFTTNAIEGSKLTINAWQDRFTIWLTGIASAAWITGLPATITASLAFAAALAQLIRLAGWKPYRTFSKPLLWILHFSYAWIPVGFVLLGLSTIHIVSDSAALHVLAIGAMSGLIIGMITRTALGHTGRKLIAGKGELMMYGLIQLGVASRFTAAVQAGRARDIALIVAAVAWTMAFVIYLLIYAPYLFSPRIDGKEG